MARFKLIQWQLLGGGTRIATSPHFTARMDRTGPDRTTGERSYRCVVFADRRQTVVVLREPEIVGKPTAVDWIKYHLRRLEEGKSIALRSKPNPLPGREARA